MSRPFINYRGFFVEDFAAGNRGEFCDVFAGIEFGQRGKVVGGLGGRPGGDGGVGELFVRRPYELGGLSFSHCGGGGRGGGMRKRGARRGTVW